MAQDPSAPRHRVLIVDDEESTRLLLARIVSRDLKAEVQLAGTCEQALRLSSNYAYDAILLDLLMPGVGGYGVLKEIRASPPNAATPIIMVSVVSDRQSVEQCLAAGANAYHVKPIRRAELAGTLRAQIEERRKPKKRT